MKYLVMAERNSFPAPSPEEWLAILKATKAFLTARIDDGTYDCIYLFADAASGFAVVNADSHEDIMAGIVAHPQFGFLDWEITPACDTLTSYDKFIANYEQMLA